MNGAVLVIWVATLIVAYLSLLVIVPLLLRLGRAAIKIELYASDTHAASSAITEHLEAIPVLDDTAARLRTARETGVRIASGTESLRDMLADRAGRRP